MSQIKSWEAGFVAHFRANHAEMITKIEERAKLDAVEEELKQAITTFDEGYQVNG